MKYKLSEEIIKLSVSTLWDKAKLEWTLANIYYVKSPERCLCGKYPIKEVCILLNTLTTNKAIVGNCCVKKFMGLPSDKMFAAYKRICKDNTKAINIEMIMYAVEKGWFNVWAEEFYTDTLRKQYSRLSGAQQKKRVELNQKIISKISN